MYGWRQYFCEVKLDPSEPLGMGASFHMPVPTLSYKPCKSDWSLLSHVSGHRVLRVLRFSKRFSNFRFFRWRRVRIFPLVGLLFCFGIIVVEPTFISCDNHVQKTSACLFLNYSTLLIFQIFNCQRC